MKKFYLLLLLIICSLTSAFAVEIINVQGKDYPVDTVAHYKVGPGTYYTAVNLLDNSRPLNVFLLEVDNQNSFVRLKSVLAVDSTLTCERPSKMAKRKSRVGMTYFAGTNAGFYDTGKPNVGMPIHGCMADKEIARTPINTDCLIGFDEKNTSCLGYLNYEGLLTINGESKKINSVNSARGENQLILFNNLNGYYTRANEWGTEVLIELLPNNQWGINKTLNFKVLKVEFEKGNMKMGKGQAVLSGHGTVGWYLKDLKEGTEGAIKLSLTSADLVKQLDFDSMVAGDRFILRNSEVMDNDWAGDNPRTAIGLSTDKSKTFFCVVDGRRPNISVGCSTKQLADIIKSAGATDAINLDGGGSSAMYIKEYGVVNHPSDGGSERAVANGIFVATTAPEDNMIAEIKAMKSVVELLGAGIVPMPTILGYNQYETLIDTDVKGFTLSCSPEMGAINADGAFVASGKTGGKLKVSYKGIETYIKITYKGASNVNNTEISSRLLVYPNPVVDGIAYALVENYEQSPVSVKIHSSDGRLVRTKALGVVSGSVQLPIEELLPGMYLINIACGNRIDTVKLTIK